MCVPAAAAAASHYDGAWTKALANQRGALVYAGNVHEIRGYNRLARAARGEMIVLLQDDDVLKPDHGWYLVAAALFAKVGRGGLRAERV